MAGSIPDWAKPYFTAEELNQVNAAIATAENKTDAEILPLVVRRSTPTLVPWLVLCLIFCVLYIFVLLPSPIYGEVPVLVWDGILLLCFALAYLLGKIHWLQRLLLPEAYKLQHVENRALIEFHSSPAHTTRNRTGVLIFISLMERKAVILCDKGIDEKVTPGLWDETLDLLLSALHEKNGAAAFTKAIENIAPILANIAPLRERNPNELKDQVLFKD